MQGAVCTGNYYITLPSQIGDTHKVNILLNSGARHDVQDHNGSTPLHLSPNQSIYPNTILDGANLDTTNNVGNIIIYVIS